MLLGPSAARVVDSHARSRDGRSRDSRRALRGGTGTSSPASDVSEVVSGSVDDEEG